MKRTISTLILFMFVSVLMLGGVESLDQRVEAQIEHFFDAFVQGLARAWIPILAQLKQSDPKELDEDKIHELGKRFRTIDSIPPPNWLPNFPDFYEPDPYLVISEIGGDLGNSFGVSATAMGAGQAMFSGGRFLGGDDVSTKAGMIDFNIPAWVLLPDMTTPRQEHTMTFLPNGKVLIAGGQADRNG